MTGYEVTEMCPYCESEITMTWNVESMGYKAFCPVCGKRLMLCDMCQHSGPDGEYTGRCDYGSETDSCYRNPRGRKLWMRLGIALQLTGEDEAALFCGDDADAESAIRRIIEENRFTVGGDSYIPMESIELFNQEYGTDYCTEELGVEM